MSCQSYHCIKLLLKSFGSSSLQGVFEWVDVLSRCKSDLNGAINTLFKFQLISVSKLQLRIFFC